MIALIQITNTDIFAFIDKILHLHCSFKVIESYSFVYKQKR